MKADGTRDTIKTRILILSDTHSALPCATSDDAPIPFHAPLPKADVLIHCGDLTSNGRIDQHTRAIELIDSVDADLKIVIPGNHDLTLDRIFYDRYPNEHCRWQKYSDDELRQIKDMYVGEAARAKGIRYLEEGTASFRLQNGARLNLYASAWQPEFLNWAFNYPRDQDRFNPHPSGVGPENPIPDFNAAQKGGIDVVVTHGPPLGILDRTIRGDHVGCEHLLQAVGRCRPLLHCFGHIHEGWGALIKDWELHYSDRGGPRPGDPVQQTALTDFEKPQPPFYNTNVHGLKGSGEDSIEIPSYEEQVKQSGVVVDATHLRAGDETLFVNASIMTVQYRPLNAPWVIDLELPADHV